MLPGEELEELLELEPGEAAEELLARLLDAHRYRAAAEHLRERLAGQAGYRFRSAPLPPSLRRASLAEAERGLRPGALAAAIGGLLRAARAGRPPPHRGAAGHRRRAAGAPARAAARAAASTSTRRSRDADRVTVAVTLFALLELYKQGEPTWAQDEPFGEITIEPRAAGAAPAVRHRSREAERMSLPLESTVEALLFLCAEPVDAEALADATGAELARGGGRARAAARALRVRAPRASCCASSPAAGRCRPHPDAEDAARRLLARPRTPPLTPAQAETLAIVAYLQPVSRPEIARIRGVNAESAAATLLERGLVEESGRSQFGAVLYRTTELFLRLFGLELAATSCRADRRVRPVARARGRAARAAARQAGEARARRS